MSRKRHTPVQIIKGLRRTRGSSLRRAVTLRVLGSVFAWPGLYEAAEDALAEIEAALPGVKETQQDLVEMAVEYAEKRLVQRTNRSEREPPLQALETRMKEGIAIRELAHHVEVLRLTRDHAEYALKTAVDAWVYGLRREEDHLRERGRPLTPGGLMGRAHLFLMPLRPPMRLRLLRMLLRDVVDLDVDPKQLRGMIDQERVRARQRIADKEAERDKLPPEERPTAQLGIDRLPRRSPTGVKIPEPPTLLLLTLGALALSGTAMVRYRYREPLQTTVLASSLKRRYRPAPDQPERHWLQVNNLHSEADPLWQLD